MKWLALSSEHNCRAGFFFKNKGYSKMQVEDIKLEDILYWIVLNSDNTEAIDKINKTTFPFTTRYKEFQQ